MTEAVEEIRVVRRWRVPHDGWSAASRDPLGRWWPTANATRALATTCADRCVSLRLSTASPGEPTELRSSPPPLEGQAAPRLSVRVAGEETVEHYPAD